MKELDQLVENFFQPKRDTLGLDQLVEMVEEVMDENMGKSGKGTDLEKAVVAAWNGQTPKHFQGFAPLSVAGLKSQGLNAKEAEELKKGKISKFWKDNGGTDSTSKADIKIGDKNISMKMGPSAMLFGFGPNDAKATMAAAIEEVYANKDIPQSVLGLKEMLGEMETYIIRGPLSTLKKLKDTEEDLPEDADEAIRQLIKDYPDSPEAARKDIEGKEAKTSLDQQKKAMNAITTLEQLREHVAGLDEIEQKLKDTEIAVGNVLDPTENEDLKYAFFRYALTGKKKFDEGADQIANSMLVTQDKADIKEKMDEDPNYPIERLQVFYPDLNDDLIRKIADNASWRGKFRSDSVKQGGKKTGYYKLRASIISEIKKIKGEANEILDDYDKRLRGETLNEGITDFFKSLIKKISDWFYKSFVSLGKKFVELREGFKKATDEGLDDLLNFFGIDKEQYIESATTPDQPIPSFLLPK